MITKDNWRDHLSELPHIDEEDISSFTINRDGTVSRETNLLDFNPIPCRGDDTLFFSDKDGDWFIDFMHSKNGVPYKRKISDEISYGEKLDKLITKYGLNFMCNPGGGYFYNRKLKIGIQVGDHDKKDDYKRLLKGLKSLGYERDSE